jgi:hypothetical protein
VGHDNGPAEPCAHDAVAVEVVFLPTHVSCLNWIESEFAALHYFALDGTDHRTHAEQCDAIAAGSLRGVMPASSPARLRSGSVSRTWSGYQNKVADGALGGCSTPNDRHSFAAA